MLIYLANNEHTVIRVVGKMRRKSEDAVRIVVDELPGQIFDDLQRNPWVKRIVVAMGMRITRLPMKLTLWRSISYCSGSVEAPKIIYT